MTDLKSDAELGVNTLQPRNTADIQICIHDYLHERMSEAVFRERFVFFTLNAASADIKRLAEHLQ